MSQGDMIVANQSFPAFRADMNAQFQALASTSLGTSVPSTAYQGQQWIDSDTPSASVWNWNIYDGTDSIPFAQIDTSNNRVNFHTCQGVDVASAATIDLDAAYGTIVDVTGTTTITAVTLSQGRTRIVRFTGALTLTHGASLVLPGGANIATAAGDYAIFVGYASSVVRCVGYFSGATALVAATQAQMEAASSNAVVVTPGRMQYHPGVAKFWVLFNGTGTIAVTVSHNVTSLTDNGTGDYTVNLTSAFSSANYAVVGMANSDAGVPRLVALDDDASNTASTVRIEVYSDTEAGTKADSVGINLVGYGDQ